MSNFKQDLQGYLRESVEVSVGSLCAQTFCILHFALKFVKNFEIFLS